MSAPAVSILTPTYNQSRFLPDCLDSVLAQTFPSWEQIVIDDGSTDGTPDVMRRYRDPRIRYVQQDNLGIERLAETYNRALAMSRAPLVAILEGDDYWPKDKLDALIPAFARDDIVLAYGWTEVVGERGDIFPPRVPRPEFGEWFAPGVLTNTPVGCAALAMCDVRGLTFTFPCSVVVRRAALERIGGFQARPGLWITDHPTFLRLSLEGPFHFERRTTGYWRIHEAGTTVREMDHILPVLYGEIERFRDRFGARVELTAERWRRIRERWQPHLAWASMLRARRLLLDRRWREARRHLRHAIPAATWRTKALALAALAGSYVHVSAEWPYRLTGRASFRPGTGSTWCYRPGRRARSTGLPSRP